MNLTDLPKTVHPSLKRIGRGHGSGRGGHTSSRGAKGDKARGKPGLFFEGTKTKKSLIKRLPLVRGKDKFSARLKPAVINLTQLSVFKSKDQVSLATLFEKKIINSLKLPVKILGNGAVKVSLTVSVPCSKSAKGKIIMAGGQCLGIKDTIDEKLITTQNHQLKKIKTKPVLK